MEPVWKIRRIGIRSAVTIGFIVSCAVGFVLGTIWSVMFGFFLGALSALIGETPPTVGPALVIAMPFLTAAIYGIFGTLIAFFGALFYNIAAGMFGGLALDVGFEKTPPPPPDPWDVR